MQGFNMGRYVPPDQEGITSGNQLAKKHPLGARASRLRTEGVLTVRFEMPFAVWCDHCQPRDSAIIGQGVRFNAEKRRVGNYYSSPIFSFRVRHAACGGPIEIRTDPRNTAYVVVSGGRKRDTGEGKEGVAGDSLVPSGVGVGIGIGGGGGGGNPIKTSHEQARERESAFAHLEKTIGDRAAFESARARIGDIHEGNARQWDDPYARNRALRAQFRVGRRQRERDAVVAGDLRDRMGLGIELLPESEEDARWARLVDFGSRPEGEEGGEDGDQDVKVVLARPLFGDSGGRGDDARGATATEDGGGGSKASGKAGKPSRNKLKSEIAASRMRESLVSEIVGNTRLASDPFLEPRNRVDSTKSSITLPGLKRKRRPSRESPQPPGEGPAEKVAAVSSGLVDYDSD